MFLEFVVLLGCTGGIRVLLIWFAALRGGLNTRDSAHLLFDSA